MANMTSNDVIMTSNLKNNQKFEFFIPKKRMLKRSIDCCCSMYLNFTQIDVKIIKMMSQLRKFTSNCIIKW